jgi:hypothetical protein
MTLISGLITPQAARLILLLCNMFVIPSRFAKMQDMAGNIFPSRPKSPHFQDTQDEVVQGTLCECSVECLLWKCGCDIGAERRRAAFGAAYGEFIEYFDTL